MNLLPRAATWGFALGVGALFMAENIPRIKKDLFSRLPLIGDRWAEYRDWKI